MFFGLDYQCDRMIIGVKQTMHTEILLLMRFFRWSECVFYMRLRKVY